MYVGTSCGCTENAGLRNGDGCLVSLRKRTCGGGSIVDHVCSSNSNLLTLIIDLQPSQCSTTVPSLTKVWLLAQVYTC